MKPLILLVDDNLDILAFLEEYLSDRYAIARAGNGEEALKKLGEMAVQLVITDVMMPVMDGFQLCRAIKTTPEHSHVPVVLLTVKNTLQSKIEGLENGADAYIEKPFSPEFLQVQIANLLENRSKIREYFASSPLVHIKTIAHSKADELFLEKLDESITASLEDEYLDVEKLAREMNMSRPTLHRKTKSISGLTPNELINLTRLKKAAQLLAEGRYKVYEVAAMVGYSSQTYFGRAFLKQFGMSPTDYMTMKHHEKEE